MCPSSFDLGEAAKLVVLSVTEGEDKPLKYPSIFFKSELLILNKIDLLPYVPFDIAAAEGNARSVHGNMDIVRVSCQTREGMTESGPTSIGSRPIATSADTSATPRQESPSKFRGRRSSSRILSRGFRRKRRRLHRLPRCWFARCRARRIGALKLCPAKPPNMRAR